MKDFTLRLKELPTGSGVYLMLDEYGQILYVGKAKNLKNRVRQYFQSAGTKTEKTLMLVGKIADFRYILTKTEYEALVLENNLIKEHKPFYNILLKDDKTYPYIKINVKESFPRLEIVRRLKNDGSKYFGPYMLGISAKEILELIHGAFPVRECSSPLKEGGKPKKECLNYHIGRCLAPCACKTDVEGYRKTINAVIDFLNGGDKDIKKILTKRLEEAAERQEFELAIRYRESLQILDKLLRKQIINFPKDLNIDVFAAALNDLHGVINYTVVRGGKMLGSENFPVSQAGTEGDAVSAFIMQFYEKNPVLADEIITKNEIPFAPETADYLSHKKGCRVNVLSPRGGLRGQLADMAYQNAKDNLEAALAKIATKEQFTLISLERLKDALELPKIPRRIECFDISNTGGTDKVASMAVFINGEPAKKMYRRFKIRTVKGIDDFACMQEVIGRRLRNLQSDDVSFSDCPDLIVADGGKGQLSSAYEAISPYGISVIGLAKREEEIFLPHRSDPVILERNGLPLTLLQRIRDEAHRFAVTFHRQLRNERQTRSNLRNIPGIGEKKARRLLVHFKTVENIAAASEADIVEISGFGAKDALEIIRYFGSGS